MPLFLVQDSDRPMYVLAMDWKHAIDTWKSFIAEENEISIGDNDEPKGIQLVADEDEIIMTGAFIEAFERRQIKNANTRN